MASFSHLTRRLRAVLRPDGLRTRLTALVPAGLRDHVAAGQNPDLPPGSLPLPSALWAGVVVGWAVTTSVLLYLLVHLVATGYLLPGHKL
jgi:hypothetical protein